MVSVDEDQLDEVLTGNDRRRTHTGLAYPSNLGTLHPADLSSGYQSVEIHTEPPGLEGIDRIENS
jgi:hypothetical protein